jgi:hypothetical protein
MPSSTKPPSRVPMTVRPMDFFLEMGMKFYENGVGS